MSAFVRHCDPDSGKFSWVEDDEFDLQQQIARASYADMLHDDERNEKYYIGLEKAITKIKSLGKKANVLDIGTGTGLLSMMAARLGADSIVACEAFTPMADCARKIIDENDFGDRIHLVPKRSTEMVVGPDGDMKQRANILVTEVFDSDFIGEGALLTFKHALEELLEEDSIVVPSSGRVIVQVIESERVRSWNKLNGITLDNGTVLKVPPNLEKCPGTYAVHDLQLSQFPTNQFRSIVNPQVIFSFDFLGKTKLEFNRQSSIRCVADASGTSHAIFMWWEITMDTDGDVILSCAPHWAHPSPEAKGGPDFIPWRDHWMQEIYYLPKEVPVVKGDSLNLISYHDEYGFWFDLNNNTEQIVECDKRDRPTCTCGLHIVCSYTRIGMLNDPVRREKYLSSLRSKISSDSVVICIGECSLLGLMCSLLGAKMVYCVEMSSLCITVIKEFIKTNNLTDKVKVLPVSYDHNGCRTLPYKLRQIVNEVDVFVIEPYFSTAFLSWNHLRWKVTGSSDESSIFPSNANVWAMPVQFDHLHKIRAPLSKVFNFSMFHFDTLVLIASNMSDNPIEVQPLWEYGTKSLSHAFKMFEFNLNDVRPEKDKYFNTACNIEVPGRLDAIVLWIEQNLDENNFISNGPVAGHKSVEPGKKVAWDMYTRQAVCFTKDHYPIAVDNGDKLYIESIFDCRKSDILLHLDLHCANGKTYDNLNGRPSTKFSYARQNYLMSDNKNK